MVRPFKVPLVPLVPALGILANIYLLVHIIHHPFPLFMALGALLLGLVAFLAWHGLQPDELVLPGTPSRVALERSASHDVHKFRVLVPLANPKNVPLLMEIASAIAKDNNGSVVTLRVAVLPEQLPLNLEDTYVSRARRVLEQAHQLALEYDVPVTSLVRVGHNAARAILETARERHCDLIVLGWKGYSSTKDRIMGETVDAVVTHARTDVMLVKPSDSETLRNFLVPTVGSEHAKCATDYISSLVRVNGGAVTMCSVLNPESSEIESNACQTKLDDEKKEDYLVQKVTPETKIIRNRSVSAGLIQEAESYDAVAVGAASGSIYPQIIFGNTPEAVAKHTEKPVILVKHHDPVKALVGRVLGKD